jgi:D-xylose transport system substrate-binding protein
VPRKIQLVLAALAVVLLAAVVAGCGSDKKSSTSSGGGGGGGGSAGKVAVLLPDTKSSVRWEQFDRKYLGDAFKAAGVDASIQNAQGDPATQRTQAEQAITNGAKVILLVDLDPGSGKSIIDLAHNRGIKVIDYDRLTLGGGADYYVSFDNEAVGKLQGEGLVKCIDSSGKLVKGPNQSVPDWDNQKALTIYEQMLQQKQNKIDAVLAANDGLANSVISAQNARKLGNIPVTGQDATAEGIQHILAGEQCMTVYKAVKDEADAASKLAIALAKGQKPTTNGQTANKSTQTPSVLLKPVAVTKANIKDTVIADGFLTNKEICTGKYAALCKKAGL